MSKVNQQLFMGGQIESDQERSPADILDNDPAYVEWSKKLQKQFDEEFGGNANKTGDIPPF